MHRSQADTEFEEEARPEADPVGRAAEQHRGRRHFHGRGRALAIPRWRRARRRSCWRGRVIKCAGLELSRQCLAVLAQPGILPGQGLDRRLLARRPVAGCRGLLLFLRRRDRPMPGSNRCSGSRRSPARPLAALADRAVCAGAAIRTERALGEQLLQARYLRLRRKRVLRRAAPSTGRAGKALERYSDFGRRDGRGWRPPCYGACTATVAGAGRPRNPVNKRILQTHLQESPRGQV